MSETSTKQVIVRELRANLARYLEDVARGGRVEIVSPGRVIAELRPSEVKQRASTRGRLKGQFWFVPDWWEASDELADLFEGSII
jgi:prevent-host-death family protein